MYSLFCLNFLCLSLFFDISLLHTDFKKCYNKHNCNFRLCAYTPFFIYTQAKRGFAAAAVFVCFLWEEVMVWYCRFLAEKEFNAPRATDLQEEINPLQAKQYCTLLYQNHCTWALGGSVSLCFAPFDSNCFEVSVCPSTIPGGTPPRMSVWYGMVQ